MMKKIKNALIGMVALAGAWTPGAGWSYVVVTDEHTDLIGFTYSAEDGLGARASTNTAILDPADTLFFDGPTGTTSAARPAGSQWDFLGVGAGEPIYFWPQTNGSGRIFAGFEAESISSGTFAARLTGDSRASGSFPWLKVELMAVRFFDLAGNQREAEFSLWQTSGVGASPTVWMSTADGGITGDDVFYLLEGGHSHANWGFSQAGYYQIDFRLSGVLAGSMETVETAVTTRHFGVEHQPAAVPEPGVMGLLLMACVVGGLWISRPFFNQPNPNKKP